MSRLTFIDVSHDLDRELRHPELVAEFVALGFQEIGRLVAHPENDPDGKRLAALFAPEHRDELRRDMATPTRILSSPDRLTSVEVSPFWGSPSIRFRTVLDDGSLVETHRRWDRVPPLPVGARADTPRNVDSEMLAASMPGRGRSIELVTSDSPATLWSAHRSHFARYSDERNAGPRQLQSMAEILRLVERAFEHQSDLVAYNATAGVDPTGLIVVATVALGSILILADHPIATISCLVAWFAAVRGIRSAARSDPKVDDRPRFHLADRGSA